MAKAYSYVRFSSPEQAKGDSLRRQLDLSKQYAEANGLELDTELKMTDLGISAFRGKNRVEGALAGFFKAIESGTVRRGSILLVESLDRLSRAEISDALTSFMQIINAGITLVTLSDNMVYSRKTINANMGSLMMSLVIMARAHEESATKAKRLAASWENKRASIGKKKMTGRCPEWLTLEKDRMQFAEIPERVAIVRRIFDLHCAGHGKRRIADALNLEKIPTWGRGKRKGKGWHASYIDKILHSRAVLGEIHPHRIEDGKRVPVGDPIPGYFPAVITLDQWNKANSGRVHTGGRTSKAVNNLFAGIAFDGATEIKMTYIDKACSSRKGGGCTRYLQSDRRRLEPDAQIPVWNYEEVEWAFLRVMNDLDWSSITGHGKSDAAKALAETIAAQEEKVQLFDKKIERLTEAVTSSTQEIQPLVAALEKVTGEKTAITAEIKQNRSALQRLESKTAQFAKNIGAFRQMIKEASQSTSLDLRLRLREEIRSKIARIEFRHSGWPRWQQTRFPWLNPNSIFIQFQNGAARIILIQPGKRGEPISIRMVDAPANQQESGKAG